MRTNLVSLIHHPLHICYTIVRQDIAPVVAVHEKGRWYTVVLQDVQDRGREDVGTIVKGDGDGSGGGAASDYSADRD